MTQQSSAPATPSHQDGWLAWLSVVSIAVGLTVLFWAPLWQGGTLIGGDTFSYYFPQKTFLADSLKRGEFPLWNPLVGAGYPLVAESQTGVLYPPTLLLCRFLEVGVAYSANQILHYIIAFVGMWAVGRRYGLSGGSAVLAAIVYVYGWFAPRICLEWAIIGGAYLPWCVWLVEGWLLTGSRRSLLGLAPVFGLFLLAGHFHLAFITTLALSVYVLLRLTWSNGPNVAFFSEKGGSFPEQKATLAWFSGVLLTGYLLAAVQLGPTLELMTRSQRQEFNQGNDPGYGHIPPWYLTQVLSSWVWYLPESDPDQALFQVGTLSYPCNTNKVEAHLYFGMLPLLLVVLTLGQGLLQRQWPFSRSLTLWLGIGGLGLLLATGWPFVVLKHVPGFGYFRGAGRYGILMAFAVSLLAGAAFDAWWPAIRTGVRGHSAKTGLRWCMWLVVMGLTTWDLHTVSRWVTYAVMLEEPILPMRETSEIRAELARSNRPVRLWARGSNAATLLGVSAYPVYLGLGPREYFEPPLATVYREDEDLQAPAAVAKQVAWLRRNGVTHVLSFVPLNETEWSVRRVYDGIDQMLTRAWGRWTEPMFVYELIDAPGRVVDGQGNRLDVDGFEQTSNRLSLTVSPSTDTTVVVRDLAYPGWVVSVDGVISESLVVDSMYRGVEVTAGPHRIEWTYRPRSLWLGLVVSGGALCVWIMVIWRAGTQILGESRSLDPGKTHRN
jgi:hypothetical protein